MCVIDKSKEELVKELYDLRQENELLKNSYKHVVEKYKSIKEAKKNSEYEIKTIFNFLGTGIVIIDFENFTIIDANDAAAEIIGLSKDYIIGGCCYNDICSFNECTCPVKNLMEIEDNYESVLTQTNGEQKVIIKTINKMIYQGRECVIESFIDITELKHQEEEYEQHLTELEELRETMEESLFERNLLVDDLAASEEKLSKLNATKDKFFSIISHDLRGPLGSLKSILDMMASDYDSFTKEESIKFLSLMKDSSANLFALLENLLIWSRSQRGLIEIHPDNVNLYNLANGIISVLKLGADAKSIELESHIKPDTFVYADFNQLTTIIRNLFSNSIKFCNNGDKIIVGFKPTIGNKFSSENSLIYVKDNGIGMDKKIQNKLFRIDTSVTNIGTAGEKGTGLGLILCKEFVEKHGGRIWVKSIEGKGSTFYFTLPIAKNNVN